AKNESTPTPAAPGSFLWWCDGPCGTAKAALSAQSRESNLGQIDIPSESTKLVSVIRKLAAEVKSNNAPAALLMTQYAASAPVYETLVGGRFLLVQVMDRFALAGGKRKSTESLIVYDHLGAGDGDLIAFTESREAAMPFYPEKRVPLDAYNAAILDAAVIELD